MRSRVGAMNSGCRIACSTTWPKTMKNAAPKLAAARQALNAICNVLWAASVLPRLDCVLATVTNDRMIASPSTVKLCRSTSATTPYGPSVATPR